MKRRFEFGRKLRRMFMAVWPETCPICGNVLLKHETPLCLKCLAQLPRTHSERDLPYVGAPGNSIRLVSWFVYDTEHPSHRLIHHIKYHDFRNLARKLGREFAMQKYEELKHIDIILPIPIHWTKFLRRTYNQTYEVGLGVSDILLVRVNKNLFALRPHITQTRAGRSEREQNVQGIFGIRSPEELNGKHIAILDDVVTTGATMYSALKAILEVTKPASVTFISLTRSRQW